MDLRFQYFPSSGSEFSPLIVLHGLFGSSNNWRAICKRLSVIQPVYALDLRNHGESPHTDSMTFMEMADDVHYFIKQQSLDSCHLLGHSMGGKVAMQLALSYSALINSLIVVDIAPKTYPARHNDIFTAISTINKTVIKNRNEADRLIQTIIPNQATRLFLLTNLVRDTNGDYVWRTNMESIYNNYAAISDTPTAASQQLQYCKPTLFIKGNKSSYIEAEDKQKINSLFPNTVIESIEEAGHWVHAEQPDAFTTIVQSFLKIQHSEPKL